MARSIDTRRKSFSYSLSASYRLGFHPMGPLRLISNASTRRPTRVPSPRDSKLHPELKKSSDECMVD